MQKSIVRLMVGETHARTPVSGIVLPVFSGSEKLLDAFKRILNLICVLQTTMYTPNWEERMQKYL